MILSNFSWKDSGMEIEFCTSIYQGMEQHHIATLKVKFTDEGHGQCRGKDQGSNHQ